MALKRTKPGELKNEIHHPDRIKNIGVRLPIRRKTWTVEEARRQEEMIEGLMIMGAGRGQIIAQVTRPAVPASPGQPAGLGISKSRAWVLIARIQDRWEDEDRKASRRRRGEQQRRLMRYIEACQGRRDPQNPGQWLEKPNHQALARYEKQLTLIQGTEAPVQVDLQVQHSESLAAVFSRYSLDALKAMRARALQRTALAEAYLKEHPERRPRALVEAKGETVPDDNPRP